MKSLVQSHTIFKFKERPRQCIQPFLPSFFKKLNYLTKYAFETFFLNLQSKNVTINLELGLEEVRPLWMKALVPFFEVGEKRNYF